MGGIGAIPSRSAAADGTGSYKGVCLSCRIAGGGLFNYHNFFARRKKNMARKAAKPQRVRRGGLAK